MKVQFFAYYRDAEYAGCKELIWPEKADTLYELLHQIADKYGDTFRKELLTADGESISEKSIIMVNGRRSDFIGGIKAPLKDSDTVNVFPVVAGG